MSLSGEELFSALIFFLDFQQHRYFCLRQQMLEVVYIGHWNLGVHIVFLDADDVLFLCVGCFIKIPDDVDRQIVFFVDEDHLDLVSDEVNKSVSLEEVVVQVDKI